MGFPVDEVYLKFVESDSYLHDLFHPVGLQRQLVSFLLYLDSFTLLVVAVLEKHKLRVTVRLLKVLLS